MANQEITKHYNGEAESVFYPGNHSYYVNDSGFDFKGKRYVWEKKRAQGATSVTGVMDKGKGLMMWPMWEMSKFLKQHLNTTTFKELLDPESMTLEEMLKKARAAHTVKSDRGKSVGTDAHQYVEEYFKAMMAEQQDLRKEDGTYEFSYPEKPETPNLIKTLQDTYVGMINNLKPKDWDEYGRLPKLLMDDAEMQESIFTEATMLRKSIDAFHKWVDLHKIRVVGVEETVYSRVAASKYLDEPVAQCGKFDQVLEVTCSDRCGHCYTNRVLNPSQKEFTAIYLTDFKTTNTSTDFVMGIYPEYLPQCGVYDLGYVEEHPDRRVDGHLILNASKKDGTFATFFSMDRERNREWACHLVAIKEYMWSGKREVIQAGVAHEEYIKQQILSQKEIKPQGATTA